MKIYVMTDMEGVAGVLNFPDWCSPGGRYYELGKELLTEEVNAAVDGLFAGGATSVVVSDGHGGGGIHSHQLDRRVEYLRGWPTGWPFLLDESFDAVAFVGQHAKAGTPFAHLAHTQSCEYLDLSVNGVSIGEFGQFAMCAAELGVRTIFGSGDRAFCQEARTLVPGIETVEVKRGTAPGSGDECSRAEYCDRNTAVIQMHPERAREAVRAGAERAVRRAGAEDFGIIPLEPPFECILRLRHTENRSRRRCVATHPSSVIAVMNQSLDQQRLEDESA